MSYQIIVLGGYTQPDGSFGVTGVFWLTANANAIVPLPNYTSKVPFISLSDLGNLRSGTIVEQGFDSGLFPSGTVLATVESSLQSQFTAAQSDLSSVNPPLSGLVGLSYDGASWTNQTFNPPVIPVNSTRGNIVIDMEFAIAFGYVPNMIAGRANGYIGTSATTAKAIRATVYTPQGTNAQRSIVSTSTSDKTGSTGATSITINYLNTSFQLKQDTVTLNGTVAVNTNATDIAFIESLVVASVGTQGGGNIGTINLMTGTAGGGTAWASIAPSDNTTYYAHHYVPAGVTCYLLNVSGGATAAAGAVTVNHSGNPSSTTTPQLGLGGTYPHLAGGNEDHSFVVPVAIPGPDLIWLVERPNASTTSTAYGTFEYVQF